MKKYTVGDEVWHAVCETRQERETCCVCYGKREVTLIMGNGDRAIVPCDFCSSGYEPPKGFVMEYHHLAKPEKRTITEVRVQETTSDEVREYYSRSSEYYFVLKHEDIFDTEEEATKRAQEKKQKLTEGEALRKNAVRNGGNKKYSWHVGYHKREAKSCREEAERHDKYAEICQMHARK